MCVVVFNPLAIALSKREREKNLKHGFLGIIFDGEKKLSERVKLDVNLKREFLRNFVIKF